VEPTGWLVFSSNRAVPGREGRAATPNRDIYAVRADGTGLARLTGEPGYDGDPVWAPTGESIAFASERTGMSQIWTMQADGSNPRQLTEDPHGAAHPDWSPDGKLIAYEGGPDRRSDIWTIPAAPGGEPVQLTNNVVEETAPAWSPMGDRIVFMARVGGYWQIFTIDADGRNREQITRDRRDHRYPRWFPDGRRILFNTLPSEGSPSPGQIYIMNADGGNVRQITFEDEGGNGRAFPSPDGRFIAFNSNREDDNYEIYIMRPDGSEVRRITKTLGDDFHPAWSP
jgi:TolB protein